MKITQKKMAFEPIIIELQTEQEAKLLKQIMAQADILDLNEPESNLASIIYEELNTIL